MNDSIRHHLTSTAVVAALFGIPVYVEFLAPGLQLFRNGDGTANAPLFILIRQVAIFFLMIAYCFAIAGLVGNGRSRHIGWPVAIVLLFGVFLVFLAPHSAEMGFLTPPNDWFWLLAIGIGAMIYPLFDARFFGGRVWAVLPLALCGLIGIAMYRFALFSAGSDVAPAIIREAGILLGLCAPVLLALALSASRTAGLIAALVAFGALLLSLFIGWAAYRLGLEGMPLSHADYAIEFAGDAFMLASAAIGLGLLILGTTIWANQTQNELPD